jgi:predicted RNA-binding Zn ribbon-like protein
MSEPEQRAAFQLVAGHPALDLVNTLDWRFREDGAEELLNTFDDLLRFTEQSSLLHSKQARQLLRTVSRSAGARVLKRCTELREAASGVFYAGVDGRRANPASISTLERHFNAAQLQRRLCWNSDSHLEWSWSHLEGKAELPLWLLSLSVADLLLNPSREVRACDNPECRWLFLDTSKNHTKRWCDMKVCGNRMKARRFKAQQVRETTRD